MNLAAVQEMTGHTGQVNYISVALKGDVHSTVGPQAEHAAKRIETFLGTTQGKVMLNLSSDHVTVEAVKSDDVDLAEQFGNIFTTFFLAIGLFSIAAGIMLIIMIFVMLAAERKAEMGMARAVGAQRSNLVQSFVSEGMVYNLLAGGVGVGLGVAAAFGLVVGFLRYSLGDDFGFITQHVTARSLVISFSLGVVLTFVTVVFASMKVSAVNIVAAIRGTPEDETPAARKKVSWWSIVIGLPLLIVPPLGLYFILRRGLRHLLGLAALPRRHRPGLPLHPGSQGQRHRGALLHGLHADPALPGRPGDPLPGLAAADLDDGGRDPGRLLALPRQHRRGGPRPRA